ncbi:MAG: hypothetical protein N3E40_00665 [Dehalococcoidia bacterium]|nr:hypothetical protein [Dehalococcoidia bacterium]
MSIEFKSTITPSRWLNPAFKPPQQSVDVEWRTDPLVGDIGMFLGLRPVKLEEPDFDTLVAKSLERPCPFCPENIETSAGKFLPDFIPEGRIKVGDCLLFPNIFPWVPNSAVAVFSPQHFCRHVDFNVTDMVNGLLACQEYLRRLATFCPESRYHFLGMNYLPMASSSQLHPHFQAFASSSPLTQHSRLLSASESYYNACRSHYWADYVAEEKRLDRRYIGTVGKTEWFTSFVSRSWMMDVTVVFPERVTITELTVADVTDFCHGLKRVFKYMATQNYYSFNMALYSGLQESRGFWCHARLVQRGSYGPLEQSDTGVFQVLQSSYIMLRKPEDVAREMKPFMAEP